MKITERLNVLRELMKEKKIDAYLVPTDDFHEKILKQQAAAAKEVVL